VTGFHEIDQYLQAQLLHAALTITVKLLREGGSFVAKFFKSSDLSYLYAMMKQLFEEVYVVKPQSSRQSSAEAFVVGLKFKEGAQLQISESIASLSISGKEVEEAKEEDELTF